MSDLIAVAFQEQELAFELRAELAKMQKAYLIDIEDIVVATRDEKGKVKLHQAVNLTSAGAVGGGFWGMLIGILFLNPLLGAAIGAGAGALSGRFSDIGINDEFMKGLAQNFKPGCAAVFILVRKVTADKVLEGLSSFRGKGKVLQTSLEKDREDTLREFLEAQAQEGPA
ncbi:DUF1269 domain-containing protein [Halochromatium glycolicum]|uniref:DUF1269 domain-containing protein n=1 Tax=Halochromatium glycolicum TaxID=85075 RepID=A0AAJ0U3V0_9GAMM|nr:DUF1269 domain-containing protein [Halochromatium glycolicum]MBK1704350.1 hypothetical protein [Halochromatium glycolicum]